MSKKLKQKFPSGDKSNALDAVDDVYNAKQGFIIIANGDKKKVFARFHNMGIEDIEAVLASMDNEESQLLVPDTKIIT